MRQKKYILMMDNHGYIELRFGYPFYHKDLINKDESQHDCLGGGNWDIDSEGNVILFGSSCDFGAPGKQDLEKAIKNFADWDYFEWICEHIYDEVHLSKNIITK